jgi:hypothetical protein
MPKKPSDTVKALAAVHNMDRSDINSDLHTPDVPIIAETELSVTVQAFLRAGNIDAAVAAIAIAVRRAYQCEAAK